MRFLIRRPRVRLVLVALAPLTYAMTTASVLDAQAVTPRPGPVAESLPGAAPHAGALLDLRTALRRAVISSPRLAQLSARGAMSRGTLRETGQWPNPTLEYRRENLGAPILPDEFFTAYIPIDVTGRRAALRRATRSGLARVGADVEASDRDEMTAIATHWVHAARAAEQARMWAMQHDAVNELAAVEAIRAREGSVAEATAMRTQLEADRVALVRAQADGERARTRGALAVAVGLPLPVLPELAPLLSALPDSIALQRVVRNDDALWNAAQQDRPELRATVFATQEAAERERVARGGVLGDWQLQGGTKLTSGFLTGQVGLLAPMPLFNRNAGARQSASATRRLVEAERREAELQIESEVRSAAHALRVLLAVGPRLRQTAAMGDTVATSAHVAYSEGHMPLIELLDALRARIDAHAAAIDWYAAVLLAHLELQRAIGAPLIAPDPVEDPS